MTQAAFDQARVDQIRWYHEFDFGNGVRARTSHENPEGVRQVWRFVEGQLERIPFRGARVLDIGAWDGCWSFFAERHGAAHVLATDDATQRWADQGGIRLARTLLGSQVEIREDAPVYELASLGRTFDVVLFLGVHYHLWDPLYALTQIRHCCHPGTLVVIEGELAWSGMQRFEARYAESPWQECVLAAPLLDHFLRLAYLRADEQVWMHPIGAADPAGDLRVDRSLVLCRPFEGTNALYGYRPHFGLHRYDDRFRDGVAVERRARVRLLDAPATVAPGESFVIRAEVANLGTHAWRRLPPAAATPLLEGPSHTARQSLDYDAAFPGLERGGGTPDGVALYRRYIEEGWHEGTVTLGVQLRDTTATTSIERDYARGFLAEDVAPGAGAPVSVQVRAPETPGAYVLRLDMVCEYVQWFTADDTPALHVPLTVA